MRYFRKQALVIISLIVCQSIFAKQSPSQNTESITVVQAVALSYPALALTAHISGEVIVKVSLDKNGKVNEAKTIEGPNLLRPAAERAARRWLFVEAGSGIVTREAKLRFKFTLLEGQYSSEDLLAIFRPPFETETKDSTGRVVNTANSDPPNVTKPEKKRRK